MENNNIIVLLKCVSQNYEWGKYGSNSTVAKLLKGYAKECSDIIKETIPYAELWMGDHVSAPSKVEYKNKELKLREYIDTVQKEINEKSSSSPSSSSSIRGEIVEKRFGNDFPFLFKVLSIRTALSIQAHPDSQLAQVLFKKYPNIYKDPYHKPEIAIATTPFEALCSFRPLSEIQSFIDTIPEFKNSLPNNLIKLDDCKEYLKSIVTSLLKADGSLISNNLKELNNRLNEKGEEERDELDRLVLKLYSQYPGDVGVFFAYILNYIVLKPGEALFLGAGEPHAYISGDCVECMAPSDNVVRAGLTPKLKDVDTLGDMLTYRTGRPDLVVPQQRSDLSLTNYRCYQPPVDEFQVEYYHLDNCCKNINVYSSKGPSIVLVYSGNLSIENKSNQSTLNNLHTGSILFVPANTDYQFIQSDSSIPVSIYVASVSNRIFNKNNL
ncbi:hypothetical protein ACTFIY_012187 [Dictyostelium cf. discoideum]